jgi:hypothetical protein
VPAPGLSPLGLLQGGGVRPDSPSACGMVDESGQSPRPRLGGHLHGRCGRDAPVNADTTDAHRPPKPDRARCRQTSPDEKSWRVRGTWNQRCEKCRMKGSHGLCNTVFETNSTSELPTGAPQQSGRAIYMDARHVAGGRPSRVPGRVSSPTRGPCSSGPRADSRARAGQ